MNAGPCWARAAATSLAEMVGMKTKLDSLPRSLMEEAEHVRCVVRECFVVGACASMIAALYAQKTGRFSDTACIFIGTITGVAVSVVLLPFQFSLFKPGPLTRICHHLSR